MKKKKSKIVLLICFVCIFIIGYVIFKPFSRDYYKIESRVAQMSEPFIDDDEISYDTVGWIQVQGTSINLPVIYNSDGSYPTNMESFAKMLNYSSGFHNNIRISAHNIFNLSSAPYMHDDEFKYFEELMGFVYYNFAKDNKYIQLTYEGKEYLYKIFMVGFIPVSDFNSFSASPDYTEEQMEYYLKKYETYNIYDYDIDVNKKDKIISLQTCTRFFGINVDWNFFVVGRLLRDNEKIENYSVSKGKEYAKVEKILKGDDNNEEI